MKNILFLTCLLIGTFALPVEKTVLLDDVSNDPLLEQVEHPKDNKTVLEMDEDLDSFFEDYEKFMIEYEDKSNGMDYPFRALRILPDLETQTHFYTEAELLEIIYDTMPDIPEFLINFIAKMDADFIDYIVTNHPNFKELVKEMTPDTIKRFCQEVSSFGEKLGQLNEGAIINLHFIIPDIDKCIVRPTTATTASAAESISPKQVEKSKTEKSVEK